MACAPAHAGPLTTLYWDTVGRHIMRASSEEEDFLRDAPPAGVDNETWRTLVIDRNGRRYKVRTQTSTDPATGKLHGVYFDPQTHEKLDYTTENPRAIAR